MKLSNQAILIVEDEAVLAMMLEDYLLLAGARVVGPAMTVQQALDLVATEPIDVAVLDVNLRGERSEPVGVALRAKGIPYVYATGYGQATDDQGLDAQIVRKPFKLATLEAALLHALQAPRS